MKATVCEMPDKRDAFEQEWRRLVDHVRQERSQLVLLPDMPFAQWFADSRSFDRGVWAAAVEAHDVWGRRMEDLAPAVVLGSRPVDFGNGRYDEGFVWDSAHGLRSVHAKSGLSDEVGSRESAWYDSAAPEFTPVEIEGVRIGFLIGPELWAEDEARRYGEENVGVIATPRAVAATAFDRWLACGRQAARIARAYSLSSNRSGPFGGQGWIIGPDGEVLGVTSQDDPFLSLDIQVPTWTSRQGADLHRSGNTSIDPLDTGVPPY